MAVQHGCTTWLYNNNMAVQHGLTTWQYNMAVQLRCTTWLNVDQGSWGRQREGKAEGVKRVGRVGRR